MLNKPLWWGLTTINLLALIFILQINVGLLPLFTAPNFISAERIDKVNALVSDLSQGVIVSTLFFMLLVYLPARHRARQVEAVYSSSLEAIVKDLSVLATFYEQKYNIKRDLREPSELDNVTILSLEHADFSWSFSDSPTIPYGSGPIDELTWCFNEVQQIKRTITNLLMLPHITDEDQGLINPLINLKECKFFSSVEFQKKHNMQFFYAPNIVGEMFIEFFDLLAKLEKAMRKPILVIPRNLPTL